MPDYNNLQGDVPPQEMEGGETFLQRMKRLQGQQSAAMANGAPQPKQPTTPAAPGHLSPNGDAMTNTSPAPGGYPTKPPPPPMGTPVQGDGKIPPPSAAPGHVSPNGDAMTNSAPPVADKAPQAMNNNAPAPTAPTGIPAGHIEGAQPANWAALGIRPDQATQDMPLPGGKVLHHNGSGWEVVNGSAAQAPGAPGVAPGAPGSPLTMPTTLAPTQLTTPTPEAYRADHFTQFQAPDQSGLENGTADLAQAILGHPESMSPDVVNAMKNAQKEEALLQARQMSMRNAAGAAARGVSLGGNTGAMDRRIYDAADSDILKANRDIDTTAATTNFGNRLQSLDAVNNILNSRLSRATQGYGATLAGQSAQAGANQAEAASRLNTAGFDLQRQTAQADIDRAIAGMNSSNYFTGRDADRSDAALALQRELGQGGLSLDSRRLDSANSQFDRNFGLNIMQFLEGQRQANNNLGFNYTQLGQQGQRDLLNAILGSIG